MSVDSFLDSSTWCVVYAVGQSAFFAANDFLRFPLIKGIGVLGGAYLAYWFGLSAYYVQKEAENVRARYLDNGLDQVAANVEYALSVFRSNWVLFLRYIKVCRDTPAEFDSSDFFDQFKEIDQGRFQLIPGQRVTELLSNSAPWVLYQKLFAFVGAANDDMKSDFGGVLRLLAEQPNHPSRQEVVRVAFDHAQTIDRQVKHYLEFLAELGQLAEILFGVTKLRRREIEVFRNHPDVRAITARMDRIVVAVQEGENGQQARQESLREQVT